MTKPVMVFALDGVTFALWGGGQMNASHPDGRNDWFLLGTAMTDGDIVRACQAYLYNPSYYREVTGATR